MRNKFFKLASVMLVLAILVTSFSTVVSAQTTEYLYTLEIEDHVNPLSTGVQIKQSKGFRSAPEVYYAEDFTDLCIENDSEIADNMRAVMVNRGAKLDVYYTSRTQHDASSLTETFYAWIEEALKETDNPEEGDYLRWVYNSISSGSVNVLRSGTRYYYHIPLNFVYYTTKAQENLFDQQMEELIEEFDFDSNDSALYKSNVIYDYITENVVYDYENLYDDSHLLKYTAYAALVNGVAVCQGYATLYYRLARECGLQTRVVVGRSHGENHAWNIVKIGQYYYYLDSTWDAGMTEYDYYLVGSTQFTMDHTPLEDYLTSEFAAQYPISKSNYVFDNNHEHSFKNYVPNNDATCKTNGTETAFCEYGCDVKDTRVIPDSKVKCRFTSYVSNNDATCKTNGTATAYCDYGCGAKDTKEVPDSTVLHKYTDSTDESCDFGCGYIRSFGAKLVEENGEWVYYLDDFRQNITDLVKINGLWYYIEDGVWNSEIDTLHKINGKWFLIKGGMWKATKGLVEFKGKTFYVVGGKWSSDVNDLVKLNGKWYFIKAGKWDSTLESLHKLNGKWFLVKGGMWKATTGLVKYKGKQFYVIGGKWESRTGVYTINGKNYYIKGGKWDKDITTLHKKGSKYLAIKNGMWYKGKDIIIYSGKRYFVNKGYAQLSFTGKVKIGMTIYTVNNGVVRAKSSITVQSPSFV